jgi:hypothetical protein
MRSLNASLLLAAIGGPQLRIPVRGWDAETFVGHGKAMLSTIIAAAKITQRKAGVAVARICNEHFNKQVERIAKIAVSAAPSRGIKADFTLNLLSHEDLWLDAMREVLGADADVQVVNKLTPQIQSVAAQGYSKTSILLGGKPDPGMAPEIARNARAQARQLLTLNNTTSKRVENVIHEAVAKELDVNATAKVITERMKDINGSRALTIARTELNNAWTQGSVMSMQEDGDVTEVSVVGCESREEESWGKPYYQEFLYNGESTCNIEGVPIEDADKLRWHPSHTGVLVPSAFKD